jgi:hypothetical protein
MIDGFTPVMLTLEIARWDIRAFGHLCPKLEYRDHRAFSGVT